MPPWGVPRDGPRGAPLSETHLVEGSEMVREVPCTAVAVGRLSRHRLASTEHHPPVIIAAALWRY